MPADALPPFALTAGACAAHVALAWGLFRLVNWLGGHSQAFGYVALRATPQPDPAPAFNLALRAGTPLVYLLVVSAALYAVGADVLVGGIWAVVPLSLGGRIALNVWLGRGLRMDWRKTLGRAALSSGAAWVLYDRVVRHRETLLPSVEDIAGELWVIVALFVYAVLNSVQAPSAETEGRSRRYIARAYRDYAARYGGVVRDVLAAGSGRVDPAVEAVVYAVMIVEGFNRPPRVQRAERLLQRATPWASRTVGPMQVRSAVPLTDDESVRRGAARLADAVGRHRETWDPAGAAAAEYNRDDGYVADVRGVHAVVVELFYAGDSAGL